MTILSTTSPGPAHPGAHPALASARASWDIDIYEQLEGYQALRHALTGAPGPAHRAGQGLRACAAAAARASRPGMKWGFIPQGPTGPGAKPKYLVINADEGEPGTCKDIPTMMADPHSLIEGCIITCYAIRANFCAIYVRGEALHPLRRVRYAVEQAYAKGYLGRDILGSGFDLDIVVHAGRGRLHLRRGDGAARLAGGPPRPAPAQAAVPGHRGPLRLADGGQQRRDDRLGPGDRAGRQLTGSARWAREKSPGPKIYSLSGHVDAARPVRGPDGHHAAAAAGAGGRHEGRHPAEVLDARRVVDADVHRRAPRRPAGLRGRRRAPARCSAPPRCRCFNETVSVPWAVMKWTEFYKHESCGKCTPCREGTYWLLQILRADGARRRAPQADVDTMLDVCDNILGRSFCALGDGATSPITSGIKYFRQEFLDLCHRAARGRAPGPAGRTDRSLGMTHVPARSPTRRARTAAGPEGHVRLTIDGEEVDAPKGELLIRTCERLGIIVPRFCDHPLLDPAGACRQCLVEVEMGGRPMPKPQASCTMTVADGMVVKTQHTSPVAEEGAAGGDGAAAHQPPAGLPDLRQGRRVPAAEPGDDHRAAPTPGSSTTKRTFPKPLADLHAGAARPRALRAVPALHPVLRADRRRPVHRPARARRAAADRRRAGQAVPVVLLRQHHPDLPGRRADQRGVPVPVAPVRPGVHARRLRALRVRLRACASTPAAAR